MAKAHEELEHIRKYAQKLSDENLKFTTEGLSAADNQYVAWLDLMGAGHIMATSISKTANFLVRLHMAVEIAVQKSGYELITLPINDGIFIISPTKGQLVTIVQHAMTLLAARFIATHQQQDRCLMRGGIAYGPVYMGDVLKAGVSKKKLRESEFLKRVMFGPPIIQAYRSEGNAPPYGIAVSESARAFAAPNERPFQMTHWLWWQTNAEAAPPKGISEMVQIKRLLANEMVGYFDWMAKGLLFQGVPPEKLKQWRESSAQYFSAG
jgi:class 3 adenylate cyclase